MNEYDSYSARDFVELINSQFEEHVGVHNRMDIEWGIWSREMNLAIRKRLEEDGREASIYGLIFTYWVNISQLLDLIYDAKGLREFLLKKKIEKKIEEVKNISEAIYANS